VEFNLDGSVASLEEKPKQPKSDFIVPGLYFYDNRATELARRVKRSSRGELEITDLNKIYLELGQLRVEILGTENTWFDTGTIDSLHQAENQVFNIEKRRGLKINVPEEIAWRLGFISHQELYQLSKRYSKSGYGSYLQSLLTGTDSQQVREQ
jgi:glucose-1-phosphate thymidylyltransferase